MRFRPGSNRRPPACKADVITTALRKPTFLLQGKLLIKSMVFSNGMEDVFRSAKDASLFVGSEWQINNGVTIRKKKTSIFLVTIHNCLILTAQMSNTPREPTNTEKP